jgi:hypothetical protein
MVMSLLSRFELRSPEMRAALVDYLHDWTDSFVHELYCFANSPNAISLEQYDRHVEYEM